MPTSAGQDNVRTGARNGSTRQPERSSSARAQAASRAVATPSKKPAKKPSPTKNRPAGRKAPQRRSREPEEDFLTRAVDAVGGAEDVGGFDLGEMLWALGTALTHSGRLTGEVRDLAIELAKVLIGRSELEPSRADWRFKDPAWRDNPAYRRFCQAYLAASAGLERIPESDRLESRTAERARMAVSLLTSTLAPTNSLPGNPAAVKRTFETGGMSLLRGARNFVSDVRHNGAMPSQVDRRAFRVGENLAVSPGAVVYRDDICEVIQYQPSTPEVRSRPVLMIPPQINRYYFMDLSPGRSFIEYAVSRGIQFFTISWRNPGRKQSAWTLDDYVSACLQAVDVVTEITGSDDIATLGLCAGGITMSTMLSTMAAQSDDRVKAASFGVTLLDFDVPAPIGMFQSKRLMRAARKQSDKTGVLDGRSLAKVFAWLRPNDLIWNYWVNNYLLGNDPPKFDILAWNSDSTCMSGALHAQFLEIFEENVLCSPGGIDVLGHPVDLSTITCDTYVTGAQTDHLTPWQGCYRTTQLVGGKSTFVLSQAGHIASLVNPPGNPKARMFAGPKPGPDPEKWLRAAKERKGTWWEHWAEWMIERGGPERRAPRKLGSATHKPLESAPGRYIHSH